MNNNKDYLKNYLTKLVFFLNFVFALIVSAFSFNDGGTFEVVVGCCNFLTAFYLVIRYLFIQNK